LLIVLDGKGANSAAGDSSEGKERFFNRLPDEQPTA
jgi:hypothetical protein